MSLDPDCAARGVHPLPKVRRDTLGYSFVEASDEEKFVAWYVKDQTQHAMQVTVFFIADAVVRGYVGHTNATDARGVVGILCFVQMIVCGALFGGTFFFSGRWLEIIVCVWAVLLLLLVNVSSEWRLGYLLGADAADRSDARTVALTCLIYAGVFLLSGIRTSRS